MVYQLQLTSTERPDFMLLFEVDGKHTFADLHNCIQEACKFNPDQLASFFLPSSKCGKQLEVTLLDNGFSEANRYCMTRTPIQSLINREHEKMLYVFDFFTDRLFYVELIQILMGKTQSEPSVVYKNGNAPSQLIEDEVSSKELESTDLDECLDWGDLDDYNEIFGEIESFTGGI